MSFSRTIFLCIVFVTARVVSTSKTPIFHSTILSDIMIPLSNDWTLSSSDQVFTNLTAQVPGDLLSDLMINGLIDDPYIDRNFLTQQSVWAGEVQGNASYDTFTISNNGTSKRNRIENHIQRKRTWVYSTSFSIPESTLHETSWNLVFEGVKMGADVFVNDHKIGRVIDQFLRYDFKIENSVLDGGVICGGNTTTSCHNLTVIFDPSIRVNGRFSACSGGWDWSPYTQVRDSQQKRIFTLGIVKPIYLLGVGIQKFHISHVIPKVYYLGDYPTTPLPRPEGDFRLNVDVHLKFVESKSYSSLSNTTIILKSDFADQIEVPIVTPAPKQGEGLSTVVTVSLIVPKEDIELWWPNGMGKQQLYNIYIGTSNIHDTWIKKTIGFRTASLVTINETDDFDLHEALYDSSEGSGQHGMYFRVNGAIVMARGANFIPMDQLEGRQSSEAHKIAVQSAAKANMNMIRVWGGGMIPPSSFYDACDEEGILIYHDLMFVDEAGHRPSKTETIIREIRSLVRSLAPHPSLLVWSGCNECDVVMGTASEIYATLVMKTVADEDDTRPIWPSSPSRHGWKKGVRKIDSRPLTRDTSLVTWDPKAFSSALESHGPYMRGFSYSYPGVNGIDQHFPISNTPPKLKIVDIGIRYKNQFASEFGATTMSSFESMTGTISPEHWSLHGNDKPDKCVHDHGNENICKGTNVLAERNYPCDYLIVAYFGIDEEALSETGEKAFSKQLYQCLISNALWMKGEIESRRSRNYFGLLIWQLNEIWPTGGWGVIEYGRESKDGSQIIGGRWKPLMHLLESSLFRDQIAACGIHDSDDLCYVRNDSFDKVNFTVEFEAWELEDTQPKQVYEYKEVLEPGSIDWFKLPVGITSDIQIILVRLNVHHNHFISSSDDFSESVYLKDMPKNIKGLQSPVNIEIVEIRASKNGDAVIVLQSDQLALFVVLTTRAEGRFSRNCFALRPFENYIVTFQPIRNGRRVDLQHLKETLRIEHLGLYMASPGILSES